MNEDLAQEHELLGHAITQIITDYVRSLDDRTVATTATPAGLQRLFDEPLPETGISVDEILGRFSRDVAPNAMAISSPRYYGQFNPTPLPIAVWADALCSALNQNAGAWRNGPTSAMIEARVLRWLCELIGYGPKASGVLASGGSEANLLALKCARDHAYRQAINDGMRAAPGDLVVYASEQCHFSIEKSLDMLGLGRKSLRKIETDDRFHVRLDQLQKEIESDRRVGRLPCCVIGLGGATSTGVIDPLPELAAIAGEFGCWFHVDAAYGGTLTFSDIHRSKLKGIELADSVTWDPHKWMFVPFVCATTLVRDGAGVLRDSFDISPEYLSEDRGGADLEYDFFRYGQMGTRRFNSLKLWMAIKFMGRAGYARTVERHIELTHYFAGQLDLAPDFERLGEVETAVCCFRYLPDAVRAMSPAEQDRIQQQLQQRIEKSGEAYFASTILHGRRALRVNVNSILTEQRHIDDLVKLLKREGAILINDR